jgi:hypothetical protein
VKCRGDSYAANVQRVDDDIGCQISAPASHCIFTAALYREVLLELHALRATPSKSGYSFLVAGPPAGEKLKASLNAHAHTASSTNDSFSDKHEIYRHSERQSIETMLSSAF